MPKAVARKVEFTIAKFNLDVDLELIPLVLTPDQCRDYRLPRTPIKESERRKDRFEQTFGVGATELDALEALHPEKWHAPRGGDRQLPRSRSAPSRGTGDVDQELQIRKIETAVREKHSEAIEELEASFQEIVESLEEWGTKRRNSGAQSQRNLKNNVQTCLTLRFRGPKSWARQTGLCCSTLSGIT